KFCSMRISQDIRDTFSDSLGMPSFPGKGAIDPEVVAAARAGEKQMSEEFKAQGSQLYQEEETAHA
ncbi:hypothetical protein QP291_26420, partial [Escherichia coli]|nr:hypothetical protein [Escherichia coli]